MSSKFFAALLFIAIQSLSAADASAVKLYEAVEPHMGTLFQIKLYAAGEQVAQNAFRAAFVRITQLDDMLSDYKLDSELNLVTRDSAERPVHVSEELAAVVKVSQQLSAQTDGAFDITLGPLTKLWRNARKEGRLPSPTQIAAARERCGYQKLHLDETSNTITTDRSDMQLDVGAIAKGYAADEALLVITNLGIRSALVAASGDLAFSDAPPGEAGWKIGVDSLDSADKPFTSVLTLRNAAVSTSGGTEQFLQVDGKKYSHIIDPQTGTGMTKDIAVTTVARRGICADPAATAVSVLGSKRGLAFIEKQPDLAAYILTNDNGQVTVSASSRFKDLMKEQHGSN